MKPDPKLWRVGASLLACTALVISTTASQAMAAPSVHTVGSATQPTPLLTRPDAKTTHYFLSSSAIPIRTSTGVRLGLSLNIEGAVQSLRFTGPVDVDVALTKYGAQGTTPSETHDWSLFLKGQTTTGGTDKGTLAIHTGSIMHPYGQLDLAFTEASRRPDACTSGSARR